MRKMKNNCFSTIAVFNLTKSQFSGLNISQTHSLLFILTTSILAQDTFTFHLLGCSNLSSGLPHLSFCLSICSPHCRYDYVPPYVKSFNVSIALKKWKAQEPLTPSPVRSAQWSCSASPCGVVSCSLLFRQLELSPFLGLCYLSPS